MRYPILSELPIPPEGRAGWPWIEESRLTPAIMLDETPWPKVSIVTPSYNQAEFIEETIRSVLLQNYPDIEYIVIDGGSTDGSVDIIRKYEPWLSYWTSEPDRGQSHAINKGWRRSNGDIIAWLNSDDLYEASAIHKVVEFFQSNKDVDMVYGDCLVIDEKGGLEGKSPCMEFSLEALVCNTWFVAQPATFIRRSVLDTVGLINENLNLVMDWEFWLRIALNEFKISYFPETLASYRKYKNAKTSSLSVKSGEEKIEVLNNIYNNYFPLNISPYKKKAYGYIHRWAGNANYREKKFSGAVTHFFKAIKYQPSLVSNKAFLKTLIITLRSCVLP